MWSAEAPRVTAAWISRPRVGEVESGDDVIVLERRDAVFLVVVDALGHGPNAARVARAATEWVRSTTDAATVLDISNGLHRALQGSRGAAALVVAASAAGVEACGVGNVDLRSVSGRLPFVLTPGVLGVRLRSPRSCRVDAPVAERFVMFSDGISGRFDLKALAAMSPGEAATHVFAKHRHSHDDSTVLVADVAL
ncbi:MAG: SpoIIE family protein phosphatase [Labilithrix sp.]|nr:SpoIIE family protein phosphatase [Labilithrix sp.]